MPLHYVVRPTVRSPSYAVVRHAPFLIAVGRYTSTRDNNKPTSATLRGRLHLSWLVY